MNAQHEPHRDEPAPGFLHVAAKSLRRGAGWALLVAASTAAVAVTASFLVPHGVEGVAEFLNHTGMGDAVAGAANWLSNGYAHLAATAASIGGIGGAALGMLTGAISGTHDIRKHYQEVVVPKAEQASLQLGKQIGAKEREQEIVQDFKNAAEYYAHLAATVPLGEPSFNARKKIAQRNPRYQTQLDKDIKLTADTPVLGNG